MIWGPSPPSHCTLSSHFHASDSGHSCSRSRLGCHFLQQPAPISHLLHSTAVRSLSRCWALRLQGQATEMWFQATGHPGELHRRLQRCDPGYLIYLQVPEIKLRISLGDHFTYHIKSLRFSSRFIILAFTSVTHCGKIYFAYFIFVIFFDL